MSAVGRIDINADVGERPQALEDDRLILRSISSANVACGFHAGDAQTMVAICETARTLGVAIGAHVSYRDRDGFGRRALKLAPEELSAQVAEQLRTLREVAQAAATEVRYVKAHGALYNTAARDPDVAAAVAVGVASEAKLPVLCLPDSVMTQAAKAHGLAAVSEGFADRLYLADGSLAPREVTGSVLDPQRAAAQALALATGGALRTAGGGSLTLTVRSVCLHSDTPGAGALAGVVRDRLLGAGVVIEAFA